MLNNHLEFLPQDNFRETIDPEVNNAYRDLFVAQSRFNQATTDVEFVVANSELTAAIAKVDSALMRAKARYGDQRFFDDLSTMMATAPCKETEA
jgi:hypothetical protein